MEGVLEKATVLCVCKLAFSFLFLPSLAASRSPISFCCCCLVVFTDFAVTGEFQDVNTCFCFLTNKHLEAKIKNSHNCIDRLCDLSLPAFLSFLSIFESWLAELNPLSDVIALRFLLFLNHTYGMVLLLTSPLVAVETLCRLLCSRSAATRIAVSQNLTDSKVRPCYIMEGTEEEEDNGSHQDKEMPHVVSYLCCLSVWVVVAFDVGCRWKLQEVWASVCLHTTSSLIRCLPSLFSPMPCTASSFLLLAFLLLLLMIVLTTDLQRPRRAAALRTCRQNLAYNKNNNSYLQDFIPVSAGFHCSETLMTAEAQCVDADKTDGSCSIHTCSWHSKQMSTPCHGGFIVIAPKFFFAGQDQERTKRGTPMTFITEDHEDSQDSSQRVWHHWCFPSPGVRFTIGLMGVGSIFVLPLILSVNILLVQTIDNLLELCIKSVLVSTAANRRHTSVFHKEMLV